MSDSICVARAIKNNPNLWSKWYKGSWNQPGNNGKETPLSGHYGYGPSVAWSKYLKQYVLISMNRSVWNPASKEGKCSLQVSVCHNWANQQWSTPQLLLSVPGDTTIARSAYWTICNNDTTGNIKVIDKTFRLFHNLWANDIKKIEINTH